MNNKKTGLRILKYIRKYVGLLIVSIITASLSVALSLYVPILGGKAIDCIVGKNKVQFDNVYIYCFRILLVCIASGILQWIMSTINNNITYNVTRDIRRDAYEKIQKVPLKMLDSKSTGDTVSRIIADVDQFADGLLLGFSNLFTGVVSIIFTLIFMISISLKITLVVVVLTPISFFVASFIAKNTHKFFTEQSVTRGELTGNLEEAIANQKLVNAYSKQKDMIDEFDEINQSLSESSLRALFYSSLVNPSTRFVNSLVYAFVAMIAGMSVIKGNVTVGGLTSFLSYAKQYTKPFNEISGVITELQNSLVCASRVFELIDEEYEKETGEKILDINSLNGDVCINDVAFSYADDKEFIKNFNIDVKRGQRVAIIGPTGCGKTTIINLLMRFYDIKDGKISIDNVDSREYTRESVRSGFGMVLQDTWLKEGTIRDNIIVGKPDATDEEVIEAAKKSHCHNFIMRLPDGYDTYIKEDGGSLSAGQKQLLCISRIMLAVPPMLILDEATSVVDTRTEIKVQEAFAKLMEGRTSFIVAHRLSTIRNADIIVAMKDGKVVECGNHDELLEKRGMYYEMYNSR